MEGGSCNDYEYVCADPVNLVDLDGRKILTPSDNTFEVSGLWGTLKVSYDYATDTLHASYKFSTFILPVIDAPVHVEGGARVNGRETTWHYSDSDQGRYPGKNFHGTLTTYRQRRRPNGATYRVGVGDKVIISFSSSFTNQFGTFIEAIAAEVTISKPARPGR